MNVLSLFDGMSCGQIALERAGVSVDNYYASEVDKFAMQVTTNNYPNTNHTGDVCHVRSTDLPSIDLLIGGSPCQGFSFAGKRLNFDDPRSALFFEYVRLLNECAPRYFLLENVRMDKQTQDAISALLGVEPVVVNSNLLSAQNRHRLYWTNIPDVRDFTDKGIHLEDVIEDGWVDRQKSHCIDANYFKGTNLRMYKEKHRRQLVFTNPSHTSFRKLTPLECERLQTVPEGYTQGVSNTQRYKMLGNGWTVDVVTEFFKGLN